MNIPGMERITKVIVGGIYCFECMPVPEGFRVSLHFWNTLYHNEAETQTTIVDEIFSDVVKAMERLGKLYSEEKAKGFPGYYLTQHQMQCKEVKCEVFTYDN